MHGSFVMRSSLKTNWFWSSMLVVSLLFKYLWLSDDTFTIPPFVFSSAFFSSELIFKVSLNRAYPSGSYIPQSYLPSIFLQEVSFSTFNLSSCISFACKGDLIFISSDPLVTHVETYLTFANIFHTESGPLNERSTFIFILSLIFFWDFFFWV